MLKSVAQQYWDGVRRGYTEQAALFVKDEKTRALYQGKLAAEGRRFAIWTQRFCQLTAEVDDRKAEWLREGTVLVHLEVYGANSVLVPTTLSRIGNGSRGVVAKSRS